MGYQRLFTWRADNIIIQILFLYTDHNAPAMTRPIAIWRKWDGYWITGYDV
jgi:hypothetical protein